MRPRHAVRAVLAVTADNLVEYVRGFVASVDDVALDDKRLSSSISRVYDRSSVSGLSHLARPLERPVHEDHGTVVFRSR